MIAMMRLLFRVLCFLILTPPTVPLLALNLPSRPVVNMYALLGMTYIELLLLLPSPGTVYVSHFGSSFFTSVKLYRRMIA
jgi:hypothetical protein